MTGGEFIRRVQRWAKAKGLEKPNFLAKKGAGSHGTLFVGDRETTSNAIAKVRQGDYARTGGHLSLHG